MGRRVTVVVRSGESKGAIEEERRKSRRIHEERSHSEHAQVESGWWNQ